MRALSIRQPWAWLIVNGYKDIENRDWRIGRKPGFGGAYRDRELDFPARIYVHTGKSMDVGSWEEYIRHRLTKAQWKLFRELEEFPLGAIVGEIDIVACIEAADYPCSPWFMGKYGFVLYNPVAYKQPIPYPGRLGFFNVEIPSNNQCTATEPEQ